MQKNKSKHITILTPGFPKNEEDTTCIPALYLFAKELSKEETIKVSIISLYYPTTNNSYPWNGINVIALGLAQAKVFKPINLLKTVKALKILHKKNATNLIHSFWLGECAFIGHYFSKRNRIKHVTTLMGQETKPTNIWAKILPLKKMNLVTVSNFHYNHLLKNYGIKSLIIPWGVTKIFETTHSHKEIDIIGIGSLIGVKNFNLFNSVIAELKKNIPNIKAVIIGDGNLKKNLSLQIKQLKLQNNIKLKGKLSYNETQLLLKKSKVLLHTSNYESFGMVFAEAVAHNIPIVSKNVGIAKSSENWFICTNKDSFVKCCKKALTLEVVKHPIFFDISETVNKYRKLYKS